MGPRGGRIHVQYGGAAVMIHCPEYLVSYWWNRFKPSLILETR